MSISALAQPQVQSPLQYGQQPFTQPFTQQSGQQSQPGQFYGQQSYGAQQGGLPIAGMGHPIAQAISDTVLRVVAASLSTVLEQLRIDPLAQQSLCAQGQLSAQAHASVLAESARRCAPIVAAAFAQVTGIGGISPQQQIMGQTPYQMAYQTGGQQPWGQSQTPYLTGAGQQQGQMPFQTPLGQQSFGYGPQPQPWQQFPAAQTPLGW